MLKKIWAGAWLNWSVWTDLMMQISSTTSARCGSISESSAPHWPCRANLNRGPSTAASGRMNAYRWPPMTEGGIGLPSSLASCGLVVEQVELAGAPAMNRWMTRFALGAKCGDFGASGLWPSPGGAERARGERIGQQAGQGDLADADAALPEEMAAGDGRRVVTGSDSWFSPW